MKAYADNIVITPIKEDRKGALLLPMKDKVHYWKVLSVGGLVDGIKEGDEIVIAPHSDHLVEDKDQIYVVNHDHVYAIR